VDVQAADTLPPRGRPGVLDELAVAIDRGDLLFRRNAGRIRTGGRDVASSALALVSVASSTTDACSSVFSAPGRLRPEAPATRTSTAGTSCSVSASRTQSSSSTPTVKERPKFCSINSL
jgi:hypothetical protein